ncbi:diguanylate cyclase domain-containing protein [Krasilnikovia sp. M28-CT-15]|uniref:diguanylate cyclase domain-containing protein n=1 Tax=Krasilnikovia sp. M28-CT-15 TaxID=3373540 RepID=UPI00399C6D82
MPPDEAEPARTRRDDEFTPGTPVSISTGVAALRAGMTGADLFHAADTNLYRAKRAGRNRVAA